MRVESRDFTTGVLTVTEVPDPPPSPLNQLGALATLLAVHEVVPVAEAAAAVGLTPDDLTNEAIAWYVAGSL